MYVAVARIDIADVPGNVQIMLLSDVLARIGNAEPVEVVAANIPGAACGIIEAGRLENIILSPVLVD